MVMSSAMSDSLRDALGATRVAGWGTGVGVNSGLATASKRVGGSFASGTGVGRVAVLSFQIDIAGLVGVEEGMLRLALNGVRRQFSSVERTGQRTEWATSS